MKVLILGGVHGVEPQSEFIVRKLCEHFNLQKQRHQRLWGLFDVFMGVVPPQTHLTMIPDVNRYGLRNKTRTNANKVDLNRNLPANNWQSSYSDLAYFPGTSPASELETKLLVEIIVNGNFDLIISIHTNHYVQHANPPEVNFDGKDPSWGCSQAKRLAKIIELPFSTDIGYSTPGSLGSYAKDKDLSCITIELDDKYENLASWAKYGNSLVEFLNTIN